LIISRLAIYHHENNLKKADISRNLTKMGFLAAMWVKFPLGRLIAGCFQQNHELFNIRISQNRYPRGKFDTNLWVA